jgi:hypothetical protein
MTTREVLIRPPGRWHTRDRGIIVRTFRHGSRRAVGALALATTLLSGSLLAAGTGTAGAETGVPNPIVTGPIAVTVPLGDPSRDYPQLAAADLAADGYLEEEFFFSGTANRYSTPALQTGAVVESGLPYQSRMIVRRPADAKRFNGTVIVEWLNVTSGYNLDAMWLTSRSHLVREGYAYVGVSAQRVGIHAPVTGLRSWSPVRYGSLDVTVGGTVNDDSLSYDVFAQAAQSLRQPVGVDPLGGLRPERLVAAGASQSAGRLAVYHNSVHPLHEVVDAFFLYLGVGSRIRTDLPVEVFKVNTENDVLLLREGLVRQDDSGVLRTWEVAGTSHVGFDPTGARTALLLRDGLPVADPGACTLPALSRVPTNHAVNAAYEHLVRWDADGVPPPAAPRIELLSVGLVSVAARDADGNALGGLRLSQVSVPTATNTGLNSGPGFCFLFGSHVPFDAATLLERYPTHGAYVSAVAQAVAGNRRDGYVTIADAQAVRRAAAASAIGRPAS